MLVVLSFILVFVCAMIIDVAMVLWVHFSEKEWEHRAALMSITINAAALTAILFIVKASFGYIIVDMIGLYLGTIAGIRIKKKWFKPEPIHRYYCEDFRAESPDRTCICD